MNVKPRQLLAWVETHAGKAATMAAWLTQGISLVSGLASVPLIMGAYGKETAGEWYFLLVWATFFQLCDFGFSQSISRQISYSHSPRPPKDPTGPPAHYLAVYGPRAVAQLYACTRLLFRWISITILILGVVAERTCLFGGNMHGSADARICWYLIVGMAIALNEARTPGTLLVGSFQVVWGRLAIFAATLVQNVAFLAALWFRPPLWVGGIIFLGGGLLQWFLQQRLAAIRCPLFSRPRPRPRVVWAIWLASWRQGVSTTAAWFIFNVNPLLVGYLLGDAAVALIAVPTRMAMLIFGVLAEVTSAQLNYMVRLVGERDVPGLLRKFFLMLGITALPGLAIYVGYATLGKPVIAWWTRGVLHPDFAMLGFLSLYWWLALVQVQAATFVTAHGRVPFALAATVGAVLNIGLGCWLIPRMGVAGATLGTFLAQLLTSNWVAWKFAIDHLAAYNRESPGIVGRSLRAALHEVFSLRLFKSLFAR